MIKTLSRLPGVGTKSATRIAYFLLKTDRRFTESLAEQIRTLKDKMKRCSICGAYSETDPCPVCTDESRERRMMCVVEESVDVTTIEATGAYRGLYHVLHGTIAPLDGVGPEDLPIAGLLSRMESEQTEELVIATNPTVEGDTTALYISKLARSRGIRVSRLALGLPVGGDLEYADRMTLARSINGRVPMDGETD